MSEPGQAAARAVLGENSWVRVKNGDSEYYASTGFVTVMGVEHEGEEGCEVRLEEEGEKVFFRTDELELFTHVSAILAQHPEENDRG